MNSAAARLVRVPFVLMILAAAGTLAAVATSTPASAGPVASAEFRVTTTTAGNQGAPAIAMDADGDFVVAWYATQPGSTSYDVYAQRYNAAGIPQGTETRVNTTIADEQRFPTIAMDADGDYVIAWQSLNQDGDGFGVYLQRYNAAGTPQGAETLVNTFTTNDQLDPSVAMDADGDYVIAWQSHNQDTDALGIYAQRYNAAGVPQGSETRVTTIANDQTRPSVAMDAAGGYVITWESALQDGSGSGIYARRYSATGISQVSEHRVNTTISDDQLKPSIAMAAGGDYVITWQGNNQDGSQGGIYKQRYNAGSIAVGTETLVNATTAQHQETPVVSMDADGDYVISWMSFLHDGSQSGVYGQRFDRTGSPRGGETLMNLTTASTQQLSAVALDADGDFVTVWESLFQDGDGAGVYGRRFRGPEPVDLAVTQADNLDPAPVNGRVSYRIRVRNLNEPAEDTGVTTIDAAIGAATGVHVTSAIPDDATLYSATGAGWTCTAFAVSVKCRLTAPLRASEVSPSLTVTYQMSNAAGAALHPAQVVENQLDPVSSNNSEVERTSVLCSLAFASASFAVAEAGSLVVGVNRTGTNCGSASVEYETASGTATAGVDFDDVSGTLAFDDGDVAGSFPVPVMDDSLDEPVEKFKLRLMNPVGAMLGRPTLVNATITDDDLPPRINFTTSGAAGSEPGALFEVTLRLSEVSGQPVTVTLRKSGMATSGVDYFAPAKATIPAGQRTVTFDVEIADDTAVEGAEAVNLTLSSPIAATVGSLKTWRLTISDND